MAFKANIVGTAHGVLSQAPESLDALNPATNPNAGRVYGRLAAACIVAGGSKVSLTDPNAGEYLGNFNRTRNLLSGIAERLKAGDEAWAAARDWNAGGTPGTTPSSIMATINSGVRTAASAAAEASIAKALATV